MTAGPGTGDLTDVLAFLVARRGLDFREYRRDTVERRVATRLEATGCKDAADYRRRLERDPGELDRLIEALAIGVTGFFRDPEVFALLERELVPGLLGRLGPREPFRAWVPGAATGEEAYSVAMLVSAAADGSGGPARPIEVIASDIDERALETARAACYPAEAAAAVPPRLAARFLEPLPAGGVRVAAPLRDRVRVARHDLVGGRLAPTEAVIATFDLVQRVLDQTIERAFGVQPRPAK